MKTLKQKNYEKMKEMIIMIKSCDELNENNKIIIRKNNETA